MASESFEYTFSTSSSQSPVSNGDVTSPTTPDSAEGALDFSGLPGSIHDSTPRSFRSDAATVDSSSTYHHPRSARSDSDFTIDSSTLPSLSDVEESIDSNGPPTPTRRTPAISLASMEEILARRPSENQPLSEEEPQSEIYTFNPEAPRAIREHDGYVLPTPGARSHLPCPFECLDGCPILFDVREQEAWILHTLWHFGDVCPPKKMVCTMSFEDFTDTGCNEVFEDNELDVNGKVIRQSRIDNWTRYLEHFAGHFERRLNFIHENLGDNDPSDDAIALLGAILRSDQDFEMYVRRSRRALEGDIPPNHLPPSYGGRRVREVVRGSQLTNPVDYLDSTTATLCYVARAGDERRERPPARVANAWSARQIDRREPRRRHDPNRDEHIILK